jgi:hypothetical protein
MTIKETAYQLLTLKMLRDLDNNYEGHHWYEAEITILQNELKKLLKK